METQLLVGGSENDFATVLLLPTLLYSPNLASPVFLYPSSPTLYTAGFRLVYRPWIFWWEMSAMKRKIAHTNLR